jgi:hypothetical protein
MPQGLKAPRALALALVLLLATLAASCGAYSRDIEAVKQSDVPTGIVNEDLAKQFAGARGKIDWSAERPEKYKDNENIVLVRAKIDRIGRSGNKREVVLEWIRNRQTDKIDMERVLVDGQEQGMVGGALQLLLLQLD